MKKFFFTLFFALFLFTVNAQVYVAKTTSVRFSNIINVEQNKWTEWSLPDVVSVIIMHDSITNSFKIYTSNLSELSIIEHYGWSTTDKGIDLYTIACVDNDGIRCNIQIGEIEKMHFFKIDYTDFSILYDVVILNSNIKK
jgi:hypothetical protein